MKAAAMPTFFRFPLERSRMYFFFPTISPLNSSSNCEEMLARVREKRKDRNRTRFALSEKET